MEARAVDWVFYAEAKSGGDVYYYDPQSIKRVSKDLVRVWEKTSYSEKGLQNAIKEFGPKFAGLSYSVTLNEYNCSEKKVCILSLTFYNQDGGVIMTYNSSSSWNFVPPESMAEIILNIVCGSR